MAAVTLTAQTTARGGTEITFVTPDADDGIEFANPNKKGILLVKNDSAAQITVTVDITKTLDGMTLADRTINVAAGEVAAIGPFNDIYNQSDDFVRATFSSVTDVSAAVIVPGALAV